MDKKSVFLLSLGHLACDSASGAVPALLTFCVAHLGYTYEMAAGLTFAGCILSTVAQPFFGVLSDRMTKSWLIPAGILIGGVSLGLTGLFSSYWTVFLLIMISGIGGSIFHPEAARLVNQVSGKGKGTALSLFSVGGNAGFAIGPLIMATSLYWFGESGTLVTAFLSFLAAAVLLPYVRKMKRQTAVLGKEASAGGKNDWNLFSRLTFCIFSRSLAFTFANTFIPLFFLRVLHTDVLTASHLLTLLFSIGVVTTLIGGLIADRTGYVRMVQISALILLPSMLALAYVSQLWAAALLLIPIGFSIFAPFSSIVVLGQQYLRRSIGFASGVTFGIAFSFGGILAPFMGRFADSHGLIPLFSFMAAVNLLGLLFSLTLREKKNSSD